MIAEKLAFPVCDEIATQEEDWIEPSGAQIVDDRAESLHDLISNLKADAAEDAIFYLVRTNTSCDGE